MKLLSFFKKEKTPATVSNSLKELEKNIEIHGYTLINLLAPDEDEAFYKNSRIIFEKTLQLQNFDGFLSVGRINDADLRNESKALNNSYLLDAVNSFFENKFDVITGMHLFKKMGKNGILNPHQDSSLTDEKIYSSYFLWYPINGADENDGTIEIIPYSHKLPILQRSLNIAWPLLKYEKELWKLMRKIIVQKGQAVVIHSRTIHGSGINKNREIRMASNLFLKPKEAPFLHYFAEKPNSEEIEVFKVDELFYSDKNILEKPEGYNLYKTEKNTNAIYSNFNKLSDDLNYLSKS